MTITLGWWTLAGAVQIAVLVWALWPRKSEAKGGDYDFAFWIPAAARLAFAIIVSLAVLLRWSVMT